MVAAEPAEADLRTVAGRAYYALFLALFELVRASKATTFGDGRDHKLVRETMRLAIREQRGVNRLFEGIKSLAESRHKADYDMSTTCGPWNRSCALSQCQTAEECILLIPKAWPPQTLALLETYATKAYDLVVKERKG